MLALFDLDGTLIKPKSVLSFYEFYLLNSDETGDGEHRVKQFKKTIKSKMECTPSRMDLNQWFYESYFKGVSRSVLSEYSKQWLAYQLSLGGFYHEEILKELDLRRNEGYDLAIVTGSFYEVVKPIADQLGISDILCAPLEEVEGMYTGKLVASPTIATGKVEAINRFLSDNARNLKLSYGYGDDLSDLDYLEIVETPVAFDGMDLGKVALSRNWKFIQASS